MHYYQRMVQYLPIRGHKGLTNVKENHMDKKPELPLTATLRSANFISNEVRDILEKMEAEQIKQHRILIELNNLIASIDRRVKLVEKLLTKEEPKHKKETKQCNQ